MGVGPTKNCFWGDRTVFFRNDPCFIGEGTFSRGISSPTRRRFVGGDDFGDPDLGAIKLGSNAGVFLRIAILGTGDPRLSRIGWSATVKSRRLRLRRASLERTRAALFRRTSRRVLFGKVAILRFFAPNYKIVRVPLTGGLHFHFRLKRFAVLLGILSRLSRYQKRT